MATPATVIESGLDVREPPPHARAGPPRSRDAKLALIQPSLLADVQRHGKFDASCLNCGGCSVVCDLTAGDVTFPRKPIHRVLIGAKDAVLEGLEPWLCHDCGDCSVACPRQANPRESMRTLRHYLTGQYDGTGLSTRILRSRAWHLGALAVVAALVIALVVVYHLKWAELLFRDFATTGMGMEHMFPMIIYFTWIVYALPVLLLLNHVRRMHRMTMGGGPARFRHYVAEAKTLLVQATVQTQLRKCPSPNAGTPVVSWWLYATKRADAVPRWWLKHWLMVVGTVMMFVITVAFLRWFQTDSVYPVLHPQRWLGYVATAFLLWGTTDILVRRIRQPREGADSRMDGLTLPLLLWLTTVTGIVLHVFRYMGLELATHYCYAIHLAICVPMVVVEVPFGEWAHMIDRPLALYFQAVRERARKELPDEAGLAPERP